MAMKFGWSHFIHERIYVLSASQYTWDNGRDYCLSLGGDLAVEGMKNVEKRRFYQTYLILTIHTRQEIIKLERY